MTNTMKHVYNDTGFCRALYKIQNKSMEWILYCVQEEFKGVFEIYRCTREEEPCHPVTPNADKIKFEPSGMEEYDQFLKSKGLLQETH